MPLFMTLPFGTWHVASGCPMLGLSGHHANAVDGRCEEPEPGMDRQVIRQIAGCKHCSSSRYFWIKAVTQSMQSMELMFLVDQFKLPRFPRLWHPCSSSRYFWIKAVTQSMQSMESMFLVDQFKLLRFPRLWHPSPSP